MMPRIPSFRDPVIIAALISIIGLILGAVSPYAQNYLENKQPIILNLNSRQSSPQPAFSIIEWNVNAKDREDDTIYYDFFLKGHSTNGKFLEKTGWISTPSWTWETSDLDAGSNIIQVKVSDLNHLTSNYSNQIEKEFIIYILPFSQDQYVQCRNLYNQGRYASALDCYNKSIQLNPHSEIAWCDRGNTLYNLGRVSEAIADYNRSIEINQNYSSAWGGKSNALASMGLYDQAVNCVDRVINLDPSIQIAWYMKGYILYLQNKNLDAIDYYDGAIRLNSSFADAWHGRAIVLNELKRYAEAKKSEEIALSIKPTAPEWYTYSVALNGLNDKRKAMDAFNNAIKLGFVM
jgi:tetratricopeptide (TPR) repeat protein